MEPEIEIRYLGLDDGYVTWALNEVSSTIAAGKEFWAGESESSHRFCVGWDGCDFWGKAGPPREVMASHGVGHRS